MESFQKSREELIVRQQQEISDDVRALSNAGPSLTAFVDAFAAGAILTMLAETMVPEAQEIGGRAVGLATSLGFAVAASLSFLT